MPDLETDGAIHLPALFVDRIKDWRQIIGNAFPENSAGNRLTETGALQRLATELLVLPNLVAA